MPLPKQIERAFKFYSDVNFSNVVDSDHFAYLVPRNLVKIDKARRVVEFYTKVDQRVVDMARENGANLNWREPDAKKKS